MYRVSQNWHDMVVSAVLLTYLLYMTGACIYISVGIAVDEQSPEIGKSLATAWVMKLEDLLRPS